MHVVQKPRQGIGKGLIISNSYWKTRGSSRSLNYRCTMTIIIFIPIAVSIFTLDECSLAKNPGQKVSKDTTTSAHARGENYPTDHSCSLRFDTWITYWQIIFLTLKSGKIFPISLISGWFLISTYLESLTVCNKETEYCALLLQSLY